MMGMRGREAEAVPSTRATLLVILPPLRELFQPRSGGKSLAQSVSPG